MKTWLISALILLGAMNAHAQKKNITEQTIHVEGVCGMCQDRIENALSVKGVKHAHWKVETQELHIVYRNDKISEQEIHELLWQAGHDTEKGKAPEARYSQIHQCCRYREMDAH